MKAWLITWEWQGDAAAVADRVAAVLSPKLGEESVKRYVEFIYRRARSTMSEMAAYAKKPTVDSADYELGRITYGDHPWLRARKVENLEVEEDAETGLETIRWTEVVLRRSNETGNTPEKDTYSAEFRRRIIGPASDELVWDRSTGAMKPGWEDYGG